MPRIDPKTGLRDDQYEINLYPRKYTYAYIRANGGHAREALQIEKRMKAFFALEAAGRARLVRQVDDDFGFDDHFGDCFDPSNAEWMDGGMRTLKAEETRARKRLDDEGSWGIIAQVKIEDKWIDVNSCWGYIGDDVEDCASEHVGYCIDACKTEDERLTFLGFENEELRLCR